MLREQHLKSIVINQYMDGKTILSQLLSGEIRQEMYNFGLLIIR